MKCFLDDGDDTVYGLPAEWGWYTNLLRLCLHNLHVDELPAWFSNLQLLQELETNYPRFQAFPASLSQLSALERLEMVGLHAYFPENVVDLAGLPMLTNLDFGEIHSESDLADDPNEFQKYLSDEETNHLKQLEVACLVRPPPLIRNRHSSFWDHWSFAIVSKPDSKIP